jgi:iron complex outermembrane recepter protein
MSSAIRAAVAASLAFCAIAPVHAWAASLAETADTATVATDSADGNAAGAADDSGLDTVVVLGTSLKNTTSLTSTSPVDVITPEQINNSGAQTINEVLSRLDPTFNFPQGQNAVKGMGVRAASLRGVGPAYTLILVNGKRRNPSALLANTDPWLPAQVVDINTIPVSAVDHIEVLRDGAAAQYGSDAIAGVINIVLRSNADGGEVTARYGGYTDGGGHTSEFLGNKGFKLGDGGFLNVDIQKLKNGNVNRSAADWRQLFPNGDPRNADYPKDYGQWGQAGRSDWSALTNAELPFAGEWTGYGWLNYTSQDSYNYVNPERVVKSNTQSPTAAIPNQISETMVLPIYPNGYQPKMEYTSQDWDAVAGVRFADATLGKLDVGVSWGKDETARYTYNTVNPSWGPSSPTSFYLGSWVSRTTSVTADYLKDLDIKGFDSLVLSAGALHRQEYWGTGDLGNYIGYTAGPLAGLKVSSLYAPGGIYNQFASQYTGVNFAAETAIVPATGSSTAGIQPVDAGSVTRHVSGGYVGLDGEVLEHLDVGITGRYEDYSDFGSTSNYRFTARYEIIPAIAVRGTLSSGFHAPSLAELGTQSTAYTGTFTNNGISIQTPGHTLMFRPNDPRAAAFGAKPLDPEKSTTASAGLVLRPDQTSSVTLDAYDLHIRNVISATDPLQGANVSAAFVAAGLPGYTQATYYFNAWNQTTRGIDLTGQKHFDFGGSSLDLNLGASYFDTKVYDVNSKVTIAGVKNTAIGPADVRNAQTGVPKNKILLGAHYVIGRVSLESTVTRYSSYRYNVGPVPFVATANGNVDQIFHPEVYTDFKVGYQVSKALALDLAVLNAFNHYPDQYVDGNRSSGINPYSFIAPNGAAGRFVEASLTYDLP